VLKVNEVTFRMKNTVQQLNDKVEMRIDGDHIFLDAHLLLQHLVCAARQTYEEHDMTDVFSHELCTHPPSLFEMPRMMRPANKAALANEMKSSGNPGIEYIKIGSQKHYVIDGGLLLHWLSWTENSPYGDIINQYLSFVQTRFTTATVVFDGYEGGPSTKDNAHLRRTKGIIGPDVDLTVTGRLHGKKANYLSNERSKPKFIHALAAKMEKSNIKVIGFKQGVTGCGSQRKQCSCYSINTEFNTNMCASGRVFP